MVNNISMFFTDERNHRYTIEWSYGLQQNCIKSVYSHEAYSILHKLIDAQIGCKKATKEAIIKYIKAKR